ncbi:MAG: hypothetical protein ACTSQK_09725, partial [Candidatus Heimdallarchaeota archaeon]
MKIKIRNKITIIFTAFFLIICIIPFRIITSKNNYNIPAIQREHTFTLLDELPISLEELFNLDNFTSFETMLDRIESGTSFWPIKPFGTFFGHGHPEGIPRMDLNPHNHHTEIRAPVNGYINDFLTQNGTVDMIKGFECIIDTSFPIYIGNDSFLNMGHADMLKTLWDALEATGNVTVTKGELLGFTHTVGVYSILDFAYYYKDIPIPPHYAFTPNLLGKIEVLYNFLFERAKLNGLYPRAYMINDMFIHKDDEFWGNWYYKTGPYDSYIVPEDHISFYDFGVLTFVNREFTSPETYWKDETNLIKNLTNDILGIGRNYENSFTPGYKAIGTGHISLAEGDNTSGILEFRTFYGNDYGSTNTSVFGRFDMIVNHTSVIGDELQIEF